MRDIGINDMAKSKLEEAIIALHQSYGEISAMFMSQGDRKAGDIIMPTQQIFDVSLKVEKKIKAMCDGEHLCKDCHNILKLTE